MVTPVQIHPTAAAVAATAAVAVAAAAVKEAKGAKEALRKEVQAQRVDQRAQRVDRQRVAAARVIRLRMSTILSTAPPTEISRRHHMDTAVDHRAKVAAREVAPRVVIMAATATTTTQLITQ